MMTLTEMRANLHATLARLDAPPASEQEWASVQKACNAVGRAARLEKDAARKRGLAYRLSNGGDTWRKPMGRNDFVNDGCSCDAEDTCDNCGISVCAWCASEYECAGCGWVLCSRCKTDHGCEGES